MSDHSSRRVGFLVMVAALLTAASAYAGFRAAAAKRSLDRIAAETAARVPVDLSKAGATHLDLPLVATAHQHGFWVYLVPGRAELPEPLPEGEIRVEEAGDAPRARLLADRLRSEHREADGYLLCWTDEARERAPRVTISVAEGSPAWAGLGSVMVARHRICELELLPALAWSIVAGLAGLPAALLWGLVAWRLAARPAAGP